MSFASLLKNHQTSYTSSNTKNQFTLNCNRRQQNFHNSHHHHPHNHSYTNSGIKRRSVQPPSSAAQKLIDVYQNFQQDQNTQWILEIEDLRIKLHRFKPSKIKNKKFQFQRNDSGARNQIITPQNNSAGLGSCQKILFPSQQNFVQKLPSNHHHQVLEQIDPNTNNNQNIFYNPQPKNTHLNIQKQKQRKNLSPMHKMRPKTFGRQQNWMQKFHGQNKFSFGDYSQHHVGEQQKRGEKQEESITYQKQAQRRFYQQRKRNQFNNNDIQLVGYHQVNNRNNTYGVNLMNQFQKCTEQPKYHQPQQTQTTIKPTPTYQPPSKTSPTQKPLKNQLAFIQQQQSSKQVNVKNSQADPSSIIDFNLDVGFSFDQFQSKGKPAQQNAPYHTQKQFNRLNNLNNHQPQQNGQFNNQIAQSQVINLGCVNYDHNGMIGGNKNIKEMEVFEIKTQERRIAEGNMKINDNNNKQPSLKNILQLQTKNNPSQQKQTPLNIQQPTKSTKQLQSQSKPPSSEIKQQRSTSPNRIYCKLNVRTLTPQKQKFKYPRIDSKIYQTQTNIKQFHTDITSNINNQESKKQIQSQKKLEKLIEESNKLLKDRQNQKDITQNDKIKRIVLHQVENQTNRNIPSIKVLSDAQMIKTQALSKKPQQHLTFQNPSIISNPLNTINNTTKPTGLPSTPSKSHPQQQKNPSNHIFTSPRSPIQQKPKFHNQLANLQTNYNPQSAKKVQNELKSNNQIGINNRSPSNNTNLQGNNYVRYTENNAGNVQPLQSNYAYKPLGLPAYQAQGNVQNNQINNQTATNLTSHNTSYRPVTNYNQPQTYQVPSNTNIAEVKNQPLSANNQPHTKGPHYVRTYSPYYPVNDPTKNNIKPTSPYNPASTNPQQATTNIYGYTSSSPSTTNILNTNTNAQNQNPSTNNNYIKITSNYVSPLDKPTSPTIQNLGYPNPLPTIYPSQPNSKPAPLTSYPNTINQPNPNTHFLGFNTQMGIKCVQSKIYDASQRGLYTYTQQPQIAHQSLIQFSLKIDDHFNTTNNNYNTNKM